MPTLETDQLFERYRIVQCLGSGVSGESYEAEDTMLLRKVTLKLIHPKSILPDSARRQFFREMQGISILNHSYLASVLDYGEIDGRLYVARRFVSNGSLLGNNGRVWFRTPLDTSNAIHYAHQLAQALQYIHNRGYVHGALTFSNILILRGPNPENETGYAPFLLADVGLANFVRHFGEQENAPLPITAAPEQYGKRVILASDQFALAVVLYFWLTGRPPYIGSLEEIEHSKLTENITPLSSLNPKITIDQDGILLRALSVHPEDRYPSMLAFANALLATLTPKPQAALETDTEPVTHTASNMQADSEPVSHSLPQTVPDVIQPQPLPLPGIPEPATDSVPALEQAISQPALEAEPGIAKPALASITQPLPVVPQPLPEPGAPTPGPETPPQAEIPPVEQLSGTQTQEDLPEIRDEQTTIAAHLIIISPYLEEHFEVALHNEETTIGRAGSSDILLDRDDLTSRHHALLKHENDRYVLYDRHSANGVQVNGQQIKVDNGFELADGDHISIGNYELIFRFKMPEAAGQEDRSFASAP